MSDNLPQVSHDTLARRLRDAYASGAIAPLRDGLEPTDGAGAYVVQDINTRHWVEGGRRIVGRKIGLTAKAVQAQLGVDQPDYGVLFDDMQIADGGVLDPARVIQPKAEAEIALVLAREVTTASATPEDIAAATDYAVAAIEIVDSRIADWKITFADTVADNGSSAFLRAGRREEKAGRPRSVHLRHGAGGERSDRLRGRGCGVPRPSAQRRRVAGAGDGGERHTAQGG
jgi:2-keto-4-pentenoate hydratase